MGNAAQQIAEKAQTLADVLAGAARPDTPADEATAKKVAELASSMKLPDVTDRLQNLPGQVAEGKMEDAKANVGDAAERLEAAAEQLGALHRSIVAPQVDELAKVEAQLSRLDQQLDELEAPAR